MKVKASSLLLLVFAIVLAAAAALVARSLLAPAAATRQVTEQVKQEAEKPKARVLVAARDVRPGDFLSPALLRWEEVHAKELPAGAVSALPGSEGSVERNLVGATVRRAVNQGQPFTADLPLYPGNPGFIAAVLSPGMRAVSIPTSAVSSNSGLVSAGDMVDVILTLPSAKAETLGGANDPAAGINRLAAQTILENVRVLALNNNTASLVPVADEKKAPTKNAPAQPARRASYETITLEVAPEDAQRLAVAREVGELQVALRSLREDLQEKPVDLGVTHLNDTTQILGPSRGERGQVQVFLGTRQSAATF